MDAQQVHDQTIRNEVKIEALEKSICTIFEKIDSLSKDLKWGTLKTLGGVFIFNIVGVVGLILGVVRIVK